VDYEAEAEKLTEKLAEFFRIKDSQLMDKFSKGEHFLIDYLSRRDAPPMPGEISQAMHVSTARVAKILNALEQKRFITRCIDGRDRRRILVDLTDEGRSWIASGKKFMYCQVEHLLRELGEDDAREFIRLVFRITDILLEKNRQ
jgi:DNA-binding MarR family transcriptional regulator